MAAKPHLLSLTAMLLAPALMAGSLLAVSAPALAQTVIGGQGNGDVQVNLQALDQLGGGGYAASGSGASGFSYPAVSGRPPLPGEAPAPHPLLGETGNPRGLHLQVRRKAVTASSLATAEPAPKRPVAVVKPKPEVTVKPEPAPAAMPAPAPALAPAPQVATAPATTAPVTAPAPAAPAASAGQPVSTTPPAATPAAPVAPAVTPAPAATPAPTPAPQVATAPAAPKPAAPANPASQQSAMVAPKPVPAPSAQGGMVTIPFATEQADLPKGDVAALDSLAQQMANSEDRLQIRAYAASTGTDGSGARRLSLSRALAVRAYLIDKGIRSTRIDVRALGTPSDGSAADRVEVAPVGR